MIKPNRGFTLIELLVVIALMTILATIAYKSVYGYMAYTAQTSVQSLMSEYANKLEVQKDNNFTYTGFATTEATTTVLNQTAYNIKIYDLDTGGKLTDSDSVGKDFAIVATSAKTGRYSYLINSRGTQCKNLDSSKVNNVGCGTVLEGSKIL